MLVAVHQHLVSAMQHMGPWSYVALAVLVMLEGPVCTLLGTAAACDGMLSPLLVFAAAAVGNLCGDLLWYTLGRLAPLEWLLRHGPRFGLQPQALGELERDIRHHSRSIIVTAKLTWVFATTALMALGMSRVPLRSWLWADAAAEALWSGTLVFGGFYLVHWLASVQRWMALVGACGWVLVVVAAIVYLRHRRPQWSYS